MVRVKGACVGVLCMAGALLAGCSSSSSMTSADAVPERQAALTPGGAKLNIVKGKTTQAQVQEAFGTPDLVTHQDDMQIWTYDKTTYDTQREGGYWWIVVAGSSGDKVRSSSRSTILRVYFDNHDIVQDYRLSTVRY